MAKSKNRAPKQGFSQYTENNVKRKIGFNCFNNINQKRMFLITHLFLKMRVFSVEFFQKKSCLLWDESIFRFRHFVGTLF